MSNRLLELFRLQPKLYIEGSPVFIEAGVLLKDTKTNRITTQIKIRNLGEKRIIACKISIRAFEPNGDEVEGIPTYSYLDISVNQGLAFGARVPISLPNITTRMITVSVTEVVFIDGTVWSHAPCEWKQIPEQETINDLFADPEMQKQYKLEVGTDGEYVPVIDGGIFLCTCGTINISTSAHCYKCRRIFDSLVKIIDVEYLTARKDVRLQKESEELDALERKRKEAEEKARIAFELRKTKTKKIIKIGIPIVAVIALVIALIPTVIKPSIEKLSAYRKADSLAASKDYQSAIDIWTSLGDYSDSRERIRMVEEDWKESDYQIALKLTEDGQFDEASEAFRALRDYKDASSMALEAQYQKAHSLATSQDYQSAIEIWMSLGDYSDSLERAKLAETDWKEGDYQIALSLMEEEYYTEAARAFRGLAGYKDSEKKAGECINFKKKADYHTAVMAINKGDYKTAIEYFDYARGYEDARDRKTDAIYNYACQLLKDNQYFSAVLQFEKCSGYKDTASKILDAKYGYVVNNMSTKDHWTYAFLEELLSVNYSGAKSIYKNLYKWKVSVYAKNNSSWSSENMSSVSRHDDIYFHYKVSGGPPGASMRMTIRKTLPRTPYDPSTFTVWDGYDSWTYLGFASGAIPGTASVSFYDEDGNKIGSASIRLY